MDYNASLLPFHSDGFPGCALWKWSNVAAMRQKVKLATTPWPDLNNQKKK